MTPDFPPQRACPFDPPPALREQRAPVRVRIWDGSTPWLVTRHADVRAVLADRRFSADATRPGYPRRGQASAYRRRGPGSFITMDAPEHTRLRRMLISDFSPQRVEALRPSISAVAHRLLDGLAAHVDLVPAFALPLPSTVISELLGVPYADHEFFERCSRDMVDNARTEAEVQGATAELATYLGRLVAVKERRPDDDLLSRLAMERVATGEITRRDAVAMAVLLLVAGHETTSNMIALSVAYLLATGQVEAFRKAGPAAVDELLRLLTIAHTGRRRVATEDASIGGVTIRAGEGVVAAADIANRDVDAFPDPDAMHPDRAQNHHVAFGYGEHLCLGHHLARAELEIALHTLFERLPDLRLAAPVVDLPFRHSAPIYGVDALPVTW